MELILNRPLQWFACQLHANELPLRHLFAHVGRTTTGPRSLTGEIRKSLVGCEKLSVVSSTPIENTLCEASIKRLWSGARFETDSTGDPLSPVSGFKQSAAGVEWEFEDGDTGSDVFLLN
ncbi:hypothetical protein AVEN_230402-1 [Araneus ventricosus]|uniref:Uncharacterized protein n=1 Tax=Araneus ventricosus TaxID=182803 RepID=A0A4Y2U8Y9_ARAVE|nr:hypothetical protein AVEN_245186-1 [Araneus ventricosus]GBO08973.1 hypothetical protein AVEN_230402-1 [Araneus ventricosus]